MTKHFHAARIIVIILLLLIILPAVVSAQEDVVTCDHPRVSYLVERSGASCEEILSLVESGVGFGRIMKAVIIAESLPEGSNVGWRDLLEAHQEGMGWGQMYRIYGLRGRFENLDLNPEELLALRKAGLGWGQIIHARALADADIGLAFDEAVAMLQKGMGWGEIRAELGLEEGPPPWAGQGKAKEKGGNGNGQGRPPWAGQDNGNKNGRGQGSG